MAGSFPRSRFTTQLTHLISFGGIGLLAFAVDLLVFNLLRLGPLDHQIVTAKVISVVVATVVSWLGNRYLAFRSRRGGSVVREAALFAAANVGGLIIAAGCLYVSHYLLGYTSALADNISGNVIGVVLGTAFRYTAYRFFVFTAPAPTPPTPTAPTPTPPASTAPASIPLTRTKSLVLNPTGGTPE